MKILIDTNIVLDVLCNRSNFIENSLKVFRLCETKYLDGCLCAISIPNIVYIMRKELDNDRIKIILSTLTTLFDIAELRESDLIKAAELDFDDYEDAIQSTCATRIKADYIVTRNTKDFVDSTIPAVTPAELFEKIR